jgi:hypothetical protein
MKHSLFLVCVFSLALAGCTSEPDISFSEPPVVATSPSSQKAASSSVSVLAEDSSSVATSSVPRSVRIQVPFSSQAPFANWDAVHEETCEEMSLIMVQRYWTKQTLNETLAEAELQKLLAYEEAHGYKVDVTMSELADIVRDFYGLKAELVTDVSEENLQKILASGKPIIVPAAGRELGNPYFSGEGPWYHVLVAVGYEGERFVMNDPGTRRGEGYAYAKSVLLSAIHDWTGVKEETNTGKKVVLVVHP